MKKTVLSYIALVCVFLSPLTAQNTDNNPEEEIELPEVTTVISGGALTAGKDAVPDFSKVLPDRSSGQIVLPVMNENRNENASTVYAGKSLSDDQSLFAEGKIGGGWPFCFTGDFSVYRTTGNSPFEISFKHDNAEGFGGKKSSEGFFERSTQINGEKKWIGNSGEYKLGASYSSKNDGFQGKSLTFTDTLKNNFSGIAGACWKFNGGGYISTGARSFYYNRYGTEFESFNKCDFEWEKSAEFFGISPDFAAGWTNGSIDISFNADYSLQMNLKESETLAKAEGSSSAEAGHRVSATIDFSWTDEDLTVWSKAGIVTGNATGRNSFVVPFAAGADFNIPLGISSRPVVLSVEGGCSSVCKNAGELESGNPYSVAYALPVEQTDWYGILKAGIPVKDFISVNAAGEFYKTAFDNGVWRPDYNSDSSMGKSGNYFISMQNRTEFNTTAEVTVSFEKFKITGDVKSYWIDNESGKAEHTIGAAILYEPSAYWNGSACVHQYIGNGADTVPVLDVAASVRAGKSIRLALEGTDIIKLVSGSQRDFANSIYKQNSGHVTALIKFQF